MYLYKGGIKLHKDTIELAENKLILLYIIKKINLPVSRSNITQIVLENNLLNYFQLQQYLSELIEGEFISDTKQNNSHIMALTEKGISTLNFFVNRIPEKKLEIINKYLKEHTISDKNDFEALSNYIPLIGNKYMVNLKFIKNEDMLMELNLIANSGVEAERICSIWKSNPEEIYGKISNMFIQE